MRYEYDSLGQLVFEDNELLDATFIYYYDDAGNLTKKNVTRIDTNDPLRPEVSENYIYSYTNASWGDLLTSYGGVTISYDEIGNPINYYNGSYYTFAWEGRQLVSAQKGTYSFGFEYNENGIRTSKTVNGVKTEYYLDGNKIMAEKTGGNITVYVYDESGQVIGMQYHAASAADNSWEVFWFEKNLQGDIVGVYNSFGTKLISYAYDAWGNITVSYSNGGALSVAAKNPFRYRGYYYDAELALYYLNSRYYDANIGRFISADNQLSLGNDLLGTNLFSYCGNNPVNRFDPSGHFWDYIVDAVCIGVGLVDFIDEPTWGKAGFLVLDIGLTILPFIPAVGSTRHLNKVDNVIDAIDDVHDTAKTVDNTIDSYKALKKANKGTGLEVHHIVEKRFAKDLAIENTDEMLSIALTKSDHRVYTNAWRKRIGYKTGAHSPQEIWDAANRIYINRPDLLEAARKTIFR